LPKRLKMNLQFEPIDIEKQEDYFTILGRCPQVASDYSFMNLWAWADEYGLEWALEDDCVWVRQTRPETLLWAPVGFWDEIDWSGRFELDRNLETTVIRVPEKLAESWHKIFGDLTSIEEDRGHWDYIYSVKDLSELKGNRFHKKKNLLNQFVKKYDYSFMPFTPELIEKAKAMQDSWCTWRDCESSDVLSAENNAISRIFYNWEQLSGIMGGAITVDDEMVAYTVAEALTDETVVIHFEKGDTQYKGVYQAINQMFLENTAGEFSFVNREQDLNDEGLRKSKLSYLPVKFVKKYRLTLPGTFF
jgi:hypothetical protein